MMHSRVWHLICFALLFASSVAEEPLSTLAETYLDNPTMITAPEELKEPECAQGYTVNFDDIPVIQFLKFISQISGNNFIFDSADLKFNITIVSEEPTSAEDLTAALLQVLRMHNLSSVEQGSNVLIYNNAALSRLSTVVTDDTAQKYQDTAVVTRVFRLYNLSPERVQAIVKPLLSTDAIVEVSMETRHLIVTDITANVDKVRDLLEALDTPNTVLEVSSYQVQYASPQALVTYALEILGPLAQENPLQLIPQPSSKKIFIVSTPFLISKTQDVLKSLDSPDIANIEIDLPSHAMPNNNFHVYKLKYKDGREIADAIRQIGTNLQYAGTGNVDLTSTIHSIEWLQVNNSLVITGTQDAIDKVVALINDLDVAPKQVYIEVLIIDTTLSNSLDFGVEWVALGNEQNKLAYASGFFDNVPNTAPSSFLTGEPQAPLFGGARSALSAPPPNAARGGAPGTGGDIPLTTDFGLGIIGNILRHKGQSYLTLGGLVKAVEIEGDTTIVLNPRVMTEDTQEANIFVGQNIPYQTTSTVVRDTGSVTQNIQYEDIGVQLRVTPQVSPSNIVTLDIDQSISEVDTSTAQISTVGGSTSLLAPTTTKTLTNTRVHVPDGCFLVMSGHVRDQKQFQRRGIPCLGSLPLIGPAFSNTQEARTKRNLILFLRPHVITTTEEGNILTEEEGYRFNWESNPCSIIECGTERAPEDACGP